LAKKCRREEHGCDHDGDEVRSDERSTLERMITHADNRARVIGPARESQKAVEHDDERSDREELHDFTFRQSGPNEIA
jgi:hypothetical protein